MRHVDEDLVDLDDAGEHDALGAALILLVVAAFFVAIFPGNIAQYTEGVDAFGLDTDAERLRRLFFQPLLVVWALWSTGAWKAWREQRQPLTKLGGTPGR